MKITCPLSNISYTYDIFSYILPSKIIHPAITILTDPKNPAYILRDTRYTRLKFILELSSTELKLSILSLILCAPEHITISSPLGKVSDNLIREHISNLYYNIIWIHNNPHRRDQIPSFRLDNNLDNLLLGWLPEIDQARQNIRAIYRTGQISRLEGKFTLRLAERKRSGETLFHRLIDYSMIEWLFTLMGIPADDCEEYRNILYNDIWENMAIPKLSTRLLELESYLDNWFSLTPHKTIIQRRIESQLASYLDMGGTLPNDYYTKEREFDSIELDQINKTYKNLGTATRVIKPRLLFNPVPIFKPNSPDKPIRENYRDSLEFAKALVSWNRKNNLG